MRPYYISPPERPAFPPFVHYSGTNRLLTPEQCEEVIKVGTSHPLFQGSIGNGDPQAGGNNRIDPGYRSVMTRGLGLDEVPWLYDLLAERCNWTNRDYFRFDLTGIEEGIQFLEYQDGEQPGHYNWHQDYGGGPSSKRKLSIVVQLSDPADYDGCRLRLFTDQEFDSPAIGRGEMIVFPSYLPHMVSKITRGRRYALACWVCGPQFR